MKQPSTPAPGEPIVIDAHGRHAQSVAFSKDGKRLVSAGQDACVRLWSVPGFKANGVFEGHANSVNSLSFSPDGSLLGKHRKLMPTAMERVIWGTGDGSTLPVVTTKLGKIGSVICWENYMPLLRTAMYAKGVELYCAVTVDDRETWVPTVRHIALEGRCFVLSACQFVRRADLPTGYPTERFPASQDVLIRGGSCIVGPLGELLAGPVYGEECAWLRLVNWRRQRGQVHRDFGSVTLV